MSESNHTNEDVRIDDDHILDHSYDLSLIHI